MSPLQVAMVVLLSLTFPCEVRTLTGSCSKAKRFELVGTSKRMLLSEHLKDIQNKMDEHT